MENFNGQYAAWLRELYSQVDPRDIYVPIDLVTRVYMRDFNLPKEFDHLPRGSVIFDLGCEYGAGVSGLQLAYPRYRFAGIELVPQQCPEGFQPQVPIIGCSIENTTQIKNALTPQDLYPPNVILARNSMQLMHAAERYYDMSGLTARALRSMHDMLPAGGKVLIYDANSGEESYHYYAAEIVKQNLRFTWDKQFIGDMQQPCNHYFRLTKYNR